MYDHQPFYPGQKVVALRTCPQLIVKGRIYEVLSCTRFCEHDWCVDIGISVRNQTVCPKCNKAVKSKNWLASSRLFAPIQDSYADITSQLAVLPVEERVDVVKEREVVG